MNLSRRIFTRLALATSLAPSLAGAGPAAPNSPRDLGQGLAYFRVHEVAADAGPLEAAVAGDGALVLDLRYASARTEDGPLLARVLAQRHGAALLCVLVSPATPAALADSIARAEVRFVTLGVAGSVPSPRVVVDQTPEADRRAYEALDAGNKLADLLSGKIKKDRYDEVSLVNDFSNGNTAAEPPPEPDLKTVKEALPQPPALVDRVLQRAVDLDRALAAIKPRS